VRDWLVNLGVEIEHGFDTREVLEDKLLRDCLVDFTVGKGDHLELVHASVVVCMIVVASGGEFLGRGEGLILTCHVGYVEAKCISLNLEAKWQFQVLYIAHEKLVDCATHEDSYLHGDLDFLLGRNDTFFGLEAGDCSVSVVHFLPIEVNWKVSVIHELQAL
jgi:hypothetical protein